MPSRSDQLQSYQFGVRRVVSALVAHESDPLRPPSRRAGAALLGGVLVATLGLAGFAVYGLLKPGGSTKWRAGDKVIVEKESGGKYVYLDGRLHPVVNYASALLLVDAGRPGTVTVARRSLAGVPRGPLLGIPGGPDVLPARRDLMPGPWSVCSRPGTGGLRSVVAVGTPPSGGTALGGDGLLVSAPDGTVHLVWQGRRALVRDPSVVLAALVWGPPVPVAAALVNALPAAADLARVPVPGRGQPFPAVPGARLGQVFLVDGRQHAVALAGGLAPVTALQAALLLGDPATVALVRQKEPAPMTAGEYASLPRAQLAGFWTGLPSTPPRLVAAPPGDRVCVVSGGDVVMGGSVPPGVAPAGPAGASADEVYVPAGRGAVVEAVSGPDAPSGVLQVVTDQGMRHVVPAVEVLGVLGYPAASPVRVGAEIVALVPAGPMLHPEAARTAVTR